MKNPAFLFYSADFLIGCSDLTMLERGLYITLLCLQHQKGHLNKKIFGLTLGFEWVSLSDELKAKFKEDENGLIFNGRLEREITQREQFVNKQSNNGKLGGRPKSQTKAKQNPNETQMKPKQMPNKSPRDENENENENINEDENENEKGVVGEKEETPNVENHCTEGEESFCEVLDELSFDNVWEMYERKGNKKTSRSRWNGLPKKAKQLAVVHIPRYVKSTPERKFRKNFETYINKEAWNDEIISDESNGNRITITENGRPLGGGYPKNGAHPFRTNAEECRNEREMLAQVAERILQKHETKDG